MQSLVLELILQPLHWLDCLVRLVHQNNSSVHLHLYSKSRYRNLGYSRRLQNITIASCRILLSTRPRKSLLSRNISCQRCFHMGSKEPSSTAKSEPVSYLSKKSHWVLLRVRLQLHTHTHTLTPASNAIGTGNALDPCCLIASNLRIWLLLTIKESLRSTSPHKIC